MINNARVKVESFFAGKSIRLTRMPTEKTRDFDETLTGHGHKFVDLQSTAVSLVIQAPEGVDLKECWLKVKAAVDLEVVYSRSKSTWTFKIAPNTLDPEIPTTVNISVGNVEPP